MMRTSLIRVAMTTAMATLGLSFAVGCATTPKTVEFVEDGDQKGSALGLFYNDQPVDDRLNAKFDTTDWRYIIVPENGTLTVTLFVDNPNMQGTMNVHDIYGQPWHQKTFSAAAGGSYIIEDLEVAPGRYYVRMESTSGSSNYTLGARFEAEIVAQPVIPSQPTTQIDPPEKPEKPVKPKPTKPKPKPTKPKPKPNKPKPKPTTVTTGNTVTYQGTVQLVTPKGDGSIDVQISGVGKKQLKKGDKGKIGGKTVKITRCTNSRCYGLIKDADAADIRKNAEVTFTVTVP